MTCSNNMQTTQQQSNKAEVALTPKNERTTRITNEVMVLREPEEGWQPQRFRQLQQRHIEECHHGDVIHADSRKKGDNSHGKELRNKKLHK
jgi:hypothetical protein